MSNFDLRKYLAESKLVTEDKIDMINQYAKRIATGEEIQDKFFMKNKKEILDAATEIEKHMNSDIDMEEVKKPSTKMTRRELKEMIKDAFIAEAETDAEYFYSPVREDLDEADVQINIVTTMDGKTIVGTYQYGVGFKSNEAGKKMGFNDNPTSIPNGTKMSKDDSLNEVDDMTFVANLEAELAEGLYEAKEEGSGYSYKYKEGKGASEEEIQGNIDHYKKNPVVWKMLSKKDFEAMAKGEAADVKNEHYPEWKKEDFVEVLTALGESPNMSEVEFNHNQPSTFPSPSADSIEKMISGKKPLELLDILFSVWDETIKINLKNTSKEQIRKFLNAIFSQYKLGKIEDREVDQYLEILQDLPNYDSEYFNQLFNSKGSAIVGPSNPRSVSEAEEEEIERDAEEETDGGEEAANDSIVVDKRIVSLSSLPQQTRKILDSLETLRAQAEEFGDQKFITQVGNTITFFTRDFVVAGDEPIKAKVDESLEILKMKKLAGLLKEGEYAKALLKEYELDDNKLQAFIDRYNKLPRKMGTLDGGDKSYIKDYIKSNPTKLEGEFDAALFSDEATAKFLNDLLDTPRGQNISFMKAKSQYKSKPSWVTGNDANPWGPGYDYEEYEEVPGI